MLFIVQEMLAGTDHYLAAGKFSIRKDPNWLVVVPIFLSRMEILTPPSGIAASFLTSPLIEAAYRAVIWNNRNNVAKIIRYFRLMEEFNPFYN